MASTNDTDFNKKLLTPTFPDSVHSLPRRSESGWKGEVRKDINAISSKLVGYDLKIDGFGIQQRTLNETLFKVSQVIDANCDQLLKALKILEDRIAKLEQDHIEIVDLLLAHGQWIEKLENNFCQKCADQIEVALPLDQLVIDRQQKVVVGLL